MSTPKKTAPKPRRIAVTGATGFIGHAVVAALRARGHPISLAPRSPHGLGNPETLERTFEGCHTVVHCAGINREIGPQTYQAVHVEGTQNVVDAARRAGVRHLVSTSFLRARPGCGSPYHESKFAAEQIVRGSGIPYTVFKPGMVYGRGDHMLNLLSHAFHTLPVFALVGLDPNPARPVAVADLAHVVAAAATGDRADLHNRTIAVTGPERITLPDAFKRVARVVGKRPLFLPAPVAFHRTLARLCERFMRVPLIASAQVRILSEPLDEPLEAPDSLPADLRPHTMFTEGSIRAGLPAPAAFGRRDLRHCRA